MGEVEVEEYVEEMLENEEKYETYSEQILELVAGKEE